MLAQHHQTALTDRSRLEDVATCGRPGTKVRVGNSTGWEDGMGAHAVWLWTAYVTSERYVFHGCEVSIPAPRPRKYSVLRNLPVRSSLLSHTPGPVAGTFRLRCLTSVLQQDIQPPLSRLCPLGVSVEVLA